MIEDTVHSHIFSEPMEEIRKKRHTEKGREFSPYIITSAKYIKKKTPFAA